MIRFPATSTVVSPAEAAVVVTCCFGMSILVSVHAMFAGFPTFRFDDAGVVWLVVDELTTSFAALVFLRLRGYDVASLVPRPTPRGSLSGIALFFVAWIVGMLVSSPFAATSEPIDQMVAGATMTLPMNVLMAIVNGTFEEVFLLGVLMRGLRGAGLSIAVGVPLLVRVACHLYQGPGGATYIFVFGLVFSLWYLRSPVLWPVVLAHVMWDIVPFL